MADARAEAVDLGQWLREQRASREVNGQPLSGARMARMFNAYIRKQKLPVKEIHQQEISSLEKATLDAGPKRFQPWWRALREFVESGALDELLTAAAGPPEDEAAVVIEHDFRPRDNRRTPVKTPDGKVVGYVEWGPTKRGNL